MGLTTVQHELRSTLQHLQPDIVVLTETKLVAQRHSGGILRAVFQDPEGGDLYDWHCSSHEATMDKRTRAHARNGSDGVAVAVHKRWLPKATVQRKHYNCNALVSHVVGVTIHTPHGLPVDVCGVYMPFDAAHRAEIYEHLRSQARSERTIWAGDWNADPVRDASRSADLRHRGFADTAKMQMLLPDAGAPTHYPRAEGTRASCLERKEKKIDALTACQSQGPGEGCPDHPRGIRPHHPKVVAT